MILHALQDLAVVFETTTYFDDKPPEPGALSYSVFMIRDTAAACRHLKTLAVSGQPRLLECGAAHFQSHFMPLDVSPLAALTSLAVKSDGAWLAGLPAVLAGMTQLRRLRLACAYTGAGFRPEDEPPSEALQRHLEGLTNLHTLQVGCRMLQLLALSQHAHLGLLCFALLCFANWPATLEPHLNCCTFGSHHMSIGADSASQLQAIFPARRSRPRRAGCRLACRPA